MTIRAMPRLLVLVRRIADALDRAYPPQRRQPRHAEFSVATDQTFEEGYDARNVDESVPARRQ